MSRQGSYARQTAETMVKVQIELNGEGRFSGSTGIGFLDHMFNLLAGHGRFDLTVECRGDLQVDCHHTVEDLGICLGRALALAWGDKYGISRYGYAYVPMDETLARVCLDLSGRPYLVYRVTVPAERVGQLDTEVVAEFFQAISNAAGITLHIHLLEGSNSHHIIEAVFKAFARALRQAVALDPDGRDWVPSTKGVL
ncbi:MAG: imidazoleglycerol-phosphate dehydratase HisB [Heliobacteriaceae bacterium]|nr:imidazoleglycerol-phosphate dehydratase HisB [Heliobacteriaceae bacterium]MDD4588058.1 imidazoleglycerol-phosphate dehydratase HisB [Heliobacteriaceae bacterium]